MPLVPEQTFVALCQEARKTTLTNFVVALFEARGQSVRRVDTQTLVVGEEDQTRIHIANGGQSVSDENSDLVVGPTGMKTDTEVLEYSVLHQHLNYAIDREQAAALLDTYFELHESDPADTASGSDTDEPTETGGLETAAVNTCDQGSVAASARQEGESGNSVLLGSSRLSGVNWHAVASGLLMSLVLIGVVGVATLHIGDVFDSTARGDDIPMPVTSQPSTPGGAGTPIGATLEVSEQGEQSASTTPVPVSERLLVSVPPGIARNGSVNSSTLAAANRRVLSNTSYRAVLTIQLMRQGQVIGTRTTIIRRTNASYRLTQSWTGEQITVGPQIAEHSLYYANESLSVRGGTELHSQIPANQFPTRALADLLADYGSFQSATVVGTQSSRGEMLYRITAAGHPRKLTTPQQATLFVDRDGVVRYGRWTSNRSSSPGSDTIVSLRVVELRDTTVTKPPWVGEEQPN